MMIHLALVTRADLPQKVIGIDSGGMSIVPGELNGVVTYGGRSGQLDGAFAIDRERVGSRFHDRRRVTAACARTMLAQIRVRISGLMAVVPRDHETTGSEELDLGWSEIHTYLFSKKLPVCCF